MDDPGLDPAAHRAALAGLRRLNALSGTTASLAGTLAPLLQAVPADRTPRVLDVACGGGDGAIALADRLSRTLERTVRVDGCDLSPVAVETARRSAEAAGSPSRFFPADALAGPLPGANGERYDAAVSSLFLHHLTDEDAPAVLRNMAAAANAVVVSDLRRTRLGLAMAHVACRALSRSPVRARGRPAKRAGGVHPAGVRTVADAAGLGDGTIRRVWPQRFLFVWRRGPVSGPPERCDVAVIGAGPAGSLLARELAGRGRTVVLLERATFPRRKVCGACLSGHAVQELTAAGLGWAADGPRGDSANRLSAGRRGERRRGAFVRTAGGMALSRATFDAALADAAVEAGAVALFGTTASVDGSRAVTFAGRRDGRAAGRGGRGRLRVVGGRIGLEPRPSGSVSRHAGPQRDAP